MKKWAVVISYVRDKWDDEAVKATMTIRVEAPTWGMAVTNATGVFRKHLPIESYDITHILECDKPVVPAERALKATPGPWVTDWNGCDYELEIEALDADGNVSRTIGNLMFDTDEGPSSKEWQEDEANVHLTTAANDLYAALVNLLALCPSGDEQFQLAKNAAELAILQARGEA